MDELEFQAQFRPPAAGSVTEVLARRLATPDLGEAAEAAAEKAAAGARAVQREQLLIANKVAGDPFGQVSRHEAMCAELRGDLADLEAQVEAKRRLLTRAAENLIHWRDQAEEVHRAVAQSSDVDLLGPAKAALAGHQAYVQASRAAVAAVQAGTPRQAPPPFTGHGHAVRSDQPVTCPDCIAAGADGRESFLIDSDPDKARKIRELAELSEAVDHAFDHGDRAERGRGDYGRVISR